MSKTDRDNHQLTIAHPGDHRRPPGEVGTASAHLPTVSSPSILLARGGPHFRTCSLQSRPLLKSPPASPWPHPRHLRSTLFCVVLPSSPQGGAAFPSIGWCCLVPSSSSGVAISSLLFPLGLRRFLPLSFRVTFAPSPFGVVIVVPSLLLCGAVVPLTLIGRWHHSVSLLGWCCLAPSSPCGRTLSAWCGAAFSLFWVLVPCS